MTGLHNKFISKLDYDNTTMSKVSHINSSFGKVHINVLNDGVVLTQERDTPTSTGIALTPEDMEKLGKALFAVKRENFSGTLPQQNVTGIPFPIPSFGLPSVPTAPSNHMEKLKAKHKNAYAPWTSEEDEKLKLYHSEGKTPSEIAKILGRNEGAINSRMAKLGLS